MSSRYSLINGEFVPADQARIAVGDLALQRGYGVFDFFRTLRGRPVFWEDHLARLEHSCAQLRLRLPMDRAALTAQLMELARANRIDDSGIRITVTGGYSVDGYAVAEPNIVIVQQPLAVQSEPSPIRLITHAHQRQLPQVKSIDYLMALWLRPLVRERGADEVLYHHEGILGECPRNNVFVVLKDGMLVTPARNVLAGVTRKHVMKLAQGLAGCEERDVPLDALRDAREVFITSTSRKIVPVERIDDRPIGDPSTGEVTRELMKRFDAYLEREIG